MPISLSLDDDRLKRLKELARELGMDAQKLAMADVNNLLARIADDLQCVATFVL